MCGFIFISWTFLMKTRNCQFLTVFEDRIFSNRTIKKILIWNPFLTEKVREGFRTCMSSCPFRCEISENKSDLPTSDAIIFHAYDLWPVNINWIFKTPPTVQFPTIRRPEQVWVLFNKEPPCNIFWDATLLDGLFNWTAWYRKDSTVWWPYSRKYAKNSSEDFRGTFTNISHNYFKEKTKDIAGMISNCLDQGQRYKLVQKLQKYLNIDMYGRCYDNPCGHMKHPTEKVCNDMLRKYKFYLAFENSHCKDYVTEKYWGSLSRDQIPIVNWKQSHTDIVIPNSYINIYDFKDMTSFSEYIFEVLSNETLYNSYFQWKNQYIFKEPCVTCELCRMLNDRKMTSQVYHDLNGWIKDDVCQKFSVSQPFKFSSRYNY